ncbi:MAG: DUF1553 domain-containing protein [Gemmataceae bacterium]
MFAPLDRPQNGRMELDRPAAPRAALVGLDEKAGAKLPRGYFLEVRPGTPRKTHLLRRGRADLTGPDVTPGVPAVLAERQPAFLPAGRFTSNRRLSLARWVASADNPLTARVIVNRVWGWHFGVGLVRTPGDFGTRGERPTHPELLEWLAADFVARGWSLAYRLLPGRPAGERELLTVSAFAGRHGPEQACRVLLNLNEFVYPD